MNKETHISTLEQLLAMLPFATSYVERIDDMNNSHVISVTVENVRFMNASLFLSGFEPVEQEAFILSEFGKISSLSSLALQEMQKRFKKLPTKWFLHRENAEKCRELVLAGREFASGGTFQNMRVYDRNSAHSAACVDLLLPCPYALRYSDSLTAARVLRTHGIANCRMVCLQDNPFGILPRKTTFGLDYPRVKGEVFGGTWTMNELRYAVNSGLYRIDSVGWALTSLFGDHYLSEFALDMWNKRVEHSENPLGKALYKMLANRGIGRLGMLGSGIKEWKRDDAGSHRRGGVWWSQTNRKFETLSNRMFSAYVFAEQRIEMHKTLSKAVNPVYSFTDSCICEAVDVEVGDDLGQYKVKDLGETRVFGRGMYASPERQAHRGTAPYVNKNNEWTVPSGGIVPIRKIAGYD